MKPQRRLRYIDFQMTSGQFDRLVEILAKRQARLERGLTGKEREEGRKVGDLKTVARATDEAKLYPYPPR